MPTGIDETHHPELQSWVESANDPATDFPIQNLPFALFARQGSGERPRAGVGIGEMILDLGRCHERGLLGGALEQVGACCSLDQLNSLMEVDAQTYAVRADGQLLTCEPASVLPMAQRYFLF